MSSSIKWTPQQQNAICARGGTLLISAAAGSGKTAVLSQRAVERMLDPVAPIDGDRLLVATYSRAAAKEMRHRIIGKLNAQIEIDPTNPLPRRQRQLVERASISTIHSFCLELVRQNFQSVGVSPNFRIGDTAEIDDIHAGVLAEILEERYSQKENTVFLQLVELISGSRNDTKLESVLLSMYNFARSLPFYVQWIENRLGLYVDQPIGQSIWGKEVLSYAMDAADYALSLVEKGLCIISSEEALKESYSSAFLNDRDFLRVLKVFLQQGDWDGAKNLIESFAHTSLGRKKVDDKYSQELAKECRGQIKDTIEKLREYLTVCNQQEFSEDLADLFPKVQELFAIVLEFDRRVDRKKKELGVLDYSDLEHLAVELLVKPKGNTGGFIVLPFAAELAESFDEIMVDECQDINGVQDMIFQAISTGNNLFFVGDVKQSIYSFRQAMPALFIDKLDKFHVFDDLHYPAKIILSDNFRSKKTITGPINFIFSLLMSRKIGGIDYTKQEYLNAADATPADAESGWEIHLLDKRALEEDQKSHAQEARYVATLIEKMIDNRYQVKDGNGTRNVGYGDICVLLRSPKNIVVNYRRAFAEKGIPIMVDIGGDFLRSLEIMAVLNLLKVIDNPLLDVELVGAMISPLFGFTAEEIAKIRVASPRGNFYNGVRADKENPKSVQFVKTLQKLRQVSATSSVVHLVNRVYEETKMELTVQAMQGAEQRAANLLLLTEYIDQHEQRGARGLSGVLRAFDMVLQKGKDLEPAVVTLGNHAVTVMSVHKSKGLEFPVVILANSAGQFNKMDIISNTILDSEMGFACARRDPVLKKQFKTLPLIATRIKNMGALLSEEMRVLYVALTRAKERLIVTASLQDPVNYVSKLTSTLDKDRLPIHMVRSKNCYIDWILSAMLQVGEVFDAISAGQNFDSPNFRVVLGKLDEADSQKNEQVPEEPEKVDIELLEKLKTQCQYQYPFPNATQVPSKLSVSEISKEGTVKRLFAREPRFVRQSGVSATERGNAVHKFMQFCDFARAAQNAKEERSRLGDMGILSPREVLAVDFVVIKRFFESALWKKISAADRVLREYRFISHLNQMDMGKYARAEDGQPTILQGIADLIMIENNCATLVDFKTDKVKNKAVLCAMYKKQLEIYKEMISVDLGIEVKSAVLYSFTMGEEVLVF